MTTTANLGHHRGLGVDLSLGAFVTLVNSDTIFQERKAVSTLGPVSVTAEARTRATSVTVVLCPVAIGAVLAARETNDP